jgi:Cof subfamily protein (haloacid dehalogenase superfamily)
MGKFDGILICTDLDDTLLTADKRVSDENISAIEYFMSEGGYFTFATGRMPQGARLMLNYIKPNAPIICSNGTAIYDFKAEKFLWMRKLGQEAVKVIEYIDKEIPQSGIVIGCEHGVYFPKVNKQTEEHKILENFPDNYVDLHDIDEEWLKVIFMTEPEDVDLVRQAINKSQWKDSFEFMQSSPWYYEMLPKNSTKGSAIPRLAEILGISPDRTIGMGDNDNDMTLITQSGIGIAVENAIEPIKAAADYITVDNESHAVAQVIKDIENGKIVI